MNNDPPYDPEHPEDVYCMAEKWDAEHKPQEWTPEMVLEIAKNRHKHKTADEAVADAINAALDAERENLRKHKLAWESAVMQDDSERIKPLVEALVHLKMCPALPDEDLSVIDAALAKVKGGWHQDSDGLWNNPSLHIHGRETPNV
jgi:hypothetical protein